MVKMVINVQRSSTEEANMNRQKAREIVDRWMFPTEKSSYMGGLEERPILTSAHGRTVVDIEGKEYLDFQSGQMASAISYQHPRIVATIRKALSPSHCRNRCFW